MFITEKYIYCEKGNSYLRNMWMNVIIQIVNKLGSVPIARAGHMARIGGNPE
jgi:hypothetical protein